MSDNKAPALFEPSEQGMIPSDAAAVARATQEIQAARVVGQRFPRDEIKAKSRILEACKRRDLAENAEYEYSRGGTRIVGPTVDLLRAIANRWGNIRYGWTEIERKDGSSLVRCFAWDVQTNGQSERSFTVKHWRDTSGGGYPLKDERDIYELLANMAARRVRACLEEVIDADIVVAAVDQCRNTLKSGETVPLADRAVQMVGVFKEFGVTQEMIETQLGNKLEAVSENQLASLRRIYKALKDGVGKREDYFKPTPAKPQFDDAPQPETAAAEKPSKSPSVAVNRYVKAVRNLCKTGAVGEGALLDYLSKTGSTDGSVASLEELALYQNGAVLESIHNNWAAVVEQLKGDVQ
jgi:hypothetical protein